MSERIKPSDLHPDTEPPASSYYGGPCMGGPLDGQHIVQSHPYLKVRYFPGLKQLLTEPSGNWPRQANYYWSRFGYWQWRGYTSE